MPTDLKQKTEPYFATLLYYFIALLLSVSYAVFQQFYSMFSILYFIGARHCKFRNSTQNFIIVAYVAAAMSLPGFVIYLQRFYRTLA